MRGGWMQRLLSVSSLVPRVGVGRVGFPLKSPLILPGRAGCGAGDVVSRGMAAAAGSSGAEGVGGVGGSSSLSEAFRWDASELETRSLALLKEKYGYGQFRNAQMDVIEAICRGRDVLCVMATGVGKSVCYQVPALVQGKVAVVISPLISLMQDQVHALTARKVPAMFVAGDGVSGGSDFYEALQAARDGKLNVLYMTPEKLGTSSGQEGLRSLSQAGLVCVMAVDEAHCVSEWGHDFRHDYRNVGHIARACMPGVPMLAVTATATVAVQQDIVRNLQFRDNHLVSVSSFDRPNLYLEARRKAGYAEAMDELAEGVDAEGRTQPTIVYTKTRKDAETLGAYLQRKGVRADYYHASRSHEERVYVHQGFMKDELTVVVATVAFGMGIDKPDVRHVVHWGAPSTTEEYYQQIGRGGRDGEPTTCTLHWTEQDFFVSATLAEQAVAQTDEARRAQADKMENLDSIKKFCWTTGCRRKVVLGHFDRGKQTSKVPRERCCDNCRRAAEGGANAAQVEDLTAEALRFLGAVQVCQNRFGMNAYLHFLVGKKDSKKSWLQEKAGFGDGKAIASLPWWSAFGSQLMSHGLLESYTMDMAGPPGSYNKSLKLVRISESGRALLQSKGGTAGFKILPSEDMRREKAIFEGESKKEAVKIAERSSGVFLQPAERELSMLIIDYRRKLADRMNLPATALLGDPACISLAKERPSDLEKLGRVEGISGVFVSDYGDELLAFLAKACAEVSGGPLELDPQSRAPGPQAGTSGRQYFPPSVDERWPRASFGDFASSHAAPVTGAPVDPVYLAAADSFILSKIRARKTLSVGVKEPPRFQRHADGEDLASIADSEEHMGKKLQVRTVVTGVLSVAYDMFQRGIDPFAQGFNPDRIAAEIGPVDLALISDAFFQLGPSLQEKTPYHVLEWMKRNLDSKRCQHVGTEQIEFVAVLGAMGRLPQGGIPDAYSVAVGSTAPSTAQVPPAVPSHPTARVVEDFLRGSTPSQGVTAAANFFFGKVGPKEPKRFRRFSSGESLEQIAESDLFMGHSVKEETLLHSIMTVAFNEHQSGRDPLRAGFDPGRVPTLNLMSPKAFDLIAGALDSVGRVDDLSLPLLDASYREQQKDFARRVLELVGLGRDGSVGPVHVEFVALMMSLGVERWGTESGQPPAKVARHDAVSQNRVRSSLHEAGGASAHHGSTGDSNPPAMEGEHGESPSFAGVPETQSMGAPTFDIPGNFSQPSLSESQSYATGAATLHVASDSRAVSSSASMPGSTGMRALSSAPSPTVDQDKLDAPGLQAMIAARMPDGLIKGEVQDLYSKYGQRRVDELLQWL